MPPTSRTFLVAAIAALCPVGLAAQGSVGRSDVTAVKPPPGMCRVWVDGVPADKQPAPTDCATALKNKPANGRVVFGEEPASNRSSGAPPMSRALAMPVTPGRTMRRASSDSASASRDSARRALAKPKRDSVTKKPPPR